MKRSDFSGCDGLSLFFLRSSGVILFGSVLLKIVELFRGSKYLLQQDPFLARLTNHEVMVISTIIDLGVICYLIYSRSVRNRLMCVAWLAGVFACYHLVLAWIGFRGYCPCLGGPLDWMGVSRSCENGIVKWLVSYLLLGSHGLLIVGRWRVWLGVERLARAVC